MTQKALSLIVAASENDVIGVDGDLPWHLSADLKRFRKLTTGHSLIMGRKTFESIGRLLPERNMIIVTRNEQYQFEGAVVVHSIAEAIAAAGDDDQPFVAGGAQLYSEAIELVETIFMTRVHAEVDGDVFLPAIDWNQWELVESERHPADNKNDHEYSFELYSKRPNSLDGEVAVGSPALPE